MPPKVISGGDNPYDIHDAKLSSSATTHESSFVTAHEISNSGFTRQCLMQAVKALIFLMIEHNKNENRNVLDVRASLKVGLQMEQDKFPSI